MRSLWRRCGVEERSGDLHHPLHTLRHRAIIGSCGRSGAMGRFPDVDWYCDECDDWLNGQAGFDDRKDTWTCRACGHSNRISSDEIISEEDMERAYEFLENFDPKNYQ